MHTHNLISQIMEGGTQENTPIVGTPVTMNYYTDRYAATVVRVENDKTVFIMANKVKCLDYYGGQYEVLPEFEGAERKFTKRKNGRWVEDGQNLHKGLGISIGIHRHYIDPHF